MGKISLVLGGIKTGKTSFAEKLAAEKELTGGKILYLATAEALDDEMKSRIKRHQSDRPKTWTTIEEPLDIKEIFETYGNKYDLVLMDCLTLWITNKLVQAGEDYNRDEFMDSIIKQSGEFLDVVIKSKCDLVIVSNQVETGLISQYSMGRIFQDLTGLLHQKIARVSTNVIVMQAGIPTALKGEI